MTISRLMTVCLLFRWDYRHDTRLEPAHFFRHRTSTGAKKQYLSTPGQSPKGSPQQAGGSRHKDVAEHHRGIDKSNPVAAALGKVRPGPCPALPCPALPCPALPCPALPPALPCPACPISTSSGSHIVRSTKPCCGTKGCIQKLQEASVMPRPQQ